MTDSNSSNFNTGTLTIALIANGQTTDRLEVRHQGTGAGQIGVSGANVSFANTTIGTFVGGTGTTALVVTLNASATPAATQALLRNITFRTITEAPVTASRTVQVTLTDGTGLTSNQPTKTINVTAVNDIPTITGFDTAITYTENGAALLLDSDGTAITVTDVDSINFATGTMTVYLSPLSTTDVLAIRHEGAGVGQIGVSGANVTFGNMLIGTFSGGTNTASLVIALNASATPAATQALARNLTFRSTSENPSTLQRTAHITLTDGDGGSRTVSKFINVVAVADSPTIANFTPNITFTEGGAALLIDTDVTVTDPDTPDTGGGVLKVYTNVVDAADRLAIRNQGNGAGQIGVSGANVRFSNVVIGTFSGGVSTTPLTITLNAAARYASVQALLRNVTFQNTSTNPVVTPRTLRISYNNGVERIVSKTLTVIATPVLNNGSSPRQPVVANRLTVSTNPTTKRRHSGQVPDINATAALDTASAAQRRANRRRGV